MMSSDTLSLEDPNLKLFAKNWIMDAQQRVTSIACTGAYNAGKSTLINALLGQPILPTGDLPTTAVMTEISYAKKQQMFFIQDEEIYSVDDVHLQGLIKGHGVDGGYVQIQTPLFPFSNCIIYDLPGRFSTNDQHSLINRMFLHQADVVVYTMKAALILPKSELDEILALLEWLPSNNLFIVISGCGILEQDDIVHVQDYLMDFLEGHVDPSHIFLTENEKDDPRYPISRLQGALESYLNENVLAIIEESNQKKQEYIQKQQHALWRVELRGLELQKESTKEEVSKRMTELEVLQERVQAKLDHIQFDLTRYCDEIRHTFHVEIHEQYISFLNSSTSIDPSNGNDVDEFAQKITKAFQELLHEAVQKTKIKAAQDLNVPAPEDDVEHHLESHLDHISIPVIDLLAMVESIPNLKDLEKMNLDFDALPPFAKKLVDELDGLKEGLKQAKPYILLLQELLRFKFKREAKRKWKYYIRECLLESKQTLWETFKKWQNQFLTDLFDLIKQHLFQSIEVERKTLEEHRDLFAQDLTDLDVRIEYLYAQLSENNATP